MISLTIYNDPTVLSAQNVAYEEVTTLFNKMGVQKAEVLRIQVGIETWIMYLKGHVFTSFGIEISAVESQFSINKVSNFL